ncbi:hypothetical protein C0Q70_06266 [Pomacea canaliculata]|uniref:Uncharacterized protein n=1 Tax=Pomacea canaliculata TaxID=400727 RepID=A0A2T7PNH9_POMCA|nr:hypothetical protein C0Q70_06266 [Pomacea canaliculata]
MASLVPSTMSRDKSHPDHPPRLAAFLLRKDFLNHFWCLWRQEFVCSARQSLVHIAMCKFKSRETCWDRPSQLI